MVLFQVLHQPKTHLIIDNITVNSITSSSSFRIHSQTELITLRGIMIMQMRSTNQAQRNNFILKEINLTIAVASMTTGTMITNLKVKTLKMKDMIKKKLKINMKWIRNKRIMNLQTVKKCNIYRIMEKLVMLIRTTNSNNSMSLLVLHKMMVLNRIK